MNSIVNVYHRPLQFLSDHNALAPFINCVGERRSWWSTPHQWEPMSGQFNPGQTCYATMVLRARGHFQQLCVIEVSRLAEEGYTDRGAHFDIDAVGRLHVTRFPDDPSLPMLARVMTEGTGARVMQYRPHHRCTIQFARTPNGKPGYAKVFDSTIGRSIHAEHMALWEVALQGELGFSIPPPRRWDDAHRTLWQGAVPGFPIAISQLFPGNGAPLAYKMGRAIATLHQLNMLPNTMFGQEDALRQAERHAKELLARAPSLHALVDRLLDRLHAVHTRSPHQQLQPLHTDLHPQQWLWHESGLGLVDFDRMALGDPEVDIASLLTEFEFKDKRRGKAPVIADALMRGYESTAPALRRPLLDMYRAHKWLSKALRAMRKIHPDGLGRASRCVSRAFYCLSEIAADR